MKKFAIALLLIASLLAIVACNGETTTTTTSQSTTFSGSTTSSGTSTTTRTTTRTTIDPFWDEDQNGVEDWQEDEITLTYATWQHTTADVVTIESLMAQRVYGKISEHHD
ncbi:MAG: hypothetical protein MZU97_20030 [Bacillus subtilis]|nr:hypothetical protein [Bacillus subtilis]